MASPDNDLNTITEIAKKVILKMGQNKVPLIPENYHTWFEYFMGSNKELSADINHIIESGKPFDNETNEELFNKYYGDKKRIQFIQHVQSETQKILKNIFEEILNTNNMASDYENKLKTYSQKLNNADGISRVIHLIKDIISDTNKMAESSRIFKERLETANAQTETLRQRLEKTERETLIDPLTELHNRKAFDRKLKDLYEEFKKKTNTFSAIMLDIDFFKKFNDTYGHKIGDDVLQIVASTIHESVKGGDFPARYGGEEFVVLLPMTTLANACILAEHLRENVSKKRLRLSKTGEKIGNITVSLGVSEIHSKDTTDSLIERADKALYMAKESGRNNVKSEKDL